MFEVTHFKGDGIVCEMNQSNKIVVTRSSRPSPGRSLGATVTRVERPIREAVKYLGQANEIDKQAFDFVFGCTVLGPGYSQETDILRISWFIVGITIAQALSMNSSHTGSILLALEWFFGESKMPQKILSSFSFQQIKDTEDALGYLKISEELNDLLPYIVEPHGHITRNSLETSHKAKRTRKIKKESGVYYTPSDIAEFMVETMAISKRVHGSWLDPACGTGVFLRAVIYLWRKSNPNLSTNELFDFVQSNVFGIDKSALATDLSSLIVFIECAKIERHGSTYFDIWQRIKKNIICMNALRLGGTNQDGRLDIGFAEKASCQEVFPLIGDTGFDFVVMNPPYTSVSVDSDLQECWHSFSNKGFGKSGDAHLAFAEMLWQLTKEDGISAAVLPLSVGTNTTRSYRQFREALLKSSGSKKFLFFDREPQALFGEDIKTRNLILIREGSATKTSIKTSRLLKWTAEQRPSILSCDRLVDVPSSACNLFIPKLGSPEEVLTYMLLYSHGGAEHTSHIGPVVSRLTLDMATSSIDNFNDNKILISSTAYNYINCYFNGSIPVDPPMPYSCSPMNSLQFSSREDAFAAFALLSSRIAYWLWHVEGDGFHLTGEFLKRLPFWSALESKPLKEKLAEHGRQMWQAANAAMVGAINGGKQTYSFHCGFDHPSMITVELELLSYLELDKCFSRSLDAFIEATVSIDGTKRHRRTEIN